MAASDHALLGDVIKHGATFLLRDAEPQLLRMGFDGVHVAHIENEPVGEMPLKLYQVLW